MNLVTRMLGIGIEGMSTTQLKSILNGADPIKVQMSNGGMMMLTNQRIVKCVINYYGRRNMPAMKKMSNQCFATQQALNITGVNNYSCASCHMKCMDMHDNKEIYRK